MTALAALFEQRFGTAPSADIDAAAEGDPFFARVLQRGAVRRFRDAPVAGGLVELVIACALSASSKSDLQQASIIEVSPGPVRDAVADLVPKLDWVRTAPRFFVFCADTRRMERIAELRGHALDQSSVEAFFNATVDAALVMQSFVLAAEAGGLGCCPVSNLRYRGEELGRILDLPDRVFAIAGLAVGFPAEAPAIKPRLPLALTRHRDRYAPADLGAEIARYDARRSDPDEGAAPSWSHQRARHPDPDKALVFARYLERMGFRFLRRD